MKNNLLESYIQNSLKIIIKEDTEYFEVDDIDKSDFENMTFGDFLSGLRLLIKEKENIKKKENQKKHKKAAVKSALILFSAGWSEVANTALDLGGAIATALKQEEENNNLKGFPEQFKLPEEITKILDNKIENLFIKWLVNEFKDRLDEKMPKDFNMSETLNKFLKSEFNKNIVDA